MSTIVSAKTEIVRGSSHMDRYASCSTGASLFEWGGLVRLFTLNHVSAWCMLFFSPHNYFSFSAQLALTGCIELCVRIGEDDQSRVNES
jgi:hypothetical protein